MSAQFELSSTVLRPMTPASLDGVMALEVDVYPFPWSRGNFADSLVSGYTAWSLNRPAGELLGYCVAMAGLAEMHLLNITVAPAFRRQGHARGMLSALVRHCVGVGAERLWLEVRTSNVQARAAYARLGFSEMGRRKGYYPAPAGSREDAVVMSLDVSRIGAADALD